MSVERPDKRTSTVSKGNNALFTKAMRQALGAHPVTHLMGNASKSGRGLNLATYFHPMMKLGWSSISIPHTYSSRGTPLSTGTHLCIFSQHGQGNIQHKHCDIGFKVNEAVAGHFGDSATW
jgi:hypothetical protein